ncbi:Prenyltransf domain-containing protein [Cephalotus follicularis]|uniref:Alkyl transferase n=1 Tax=Cephalotus follicularis TaxID=3775 RepID=A0A1Q3CS95_CEPFO|nr:Prenyltransf domain-containing protein [Cephalotus follicularis]
MLVSVLNKMEKYKGGGFAALGTFLRRCIFRVLSVGPIPSHVAFIMDGNRRYAKKHNMEAGDGHKAGHFSLMSVLKDCYDLGVKYITVYAFSIDNFKRRPDEVHLLMELMLEKIEESLREESLVNQYGVRVYFIGNLKLLEESVRVAAERAMKLTAHNSKFVLLICVAYTSCDEIVHAVQKSCKDKWDEIQTGNANEAHNGMMEKVNGEKMNGTITLAFEESWNGETDDCQASKASRAYDGVSEGMENDTQGLCADKWDKNPSLKTSRTSNGVIERIVESEKRLEECPIIKLVDVEKHMYMAVAPEPDILIRSSGENRLSNFLLWQTSYCPLYTPAALWPEIGLWQIVWAVLNFQRNYSYLEKKKKQS